VTLLTLQSIYEARAPLGKIALRTPLTPAASLSDKRREVRLKLETIQPTGAFKLRGAANAISRLSPDQSARGVVCASTGNHGRAVSYVAARRGIKATVCLSELVPENKREAIRAAGGELHVTGRSQDEAQRQVAQLVAEKGMTEIPPFDHPDMIAGQGTIGIEILEDWPGVDTVIVPLSGGGLIGGIALAIKSASPDIRVIGVSMEHGAAMQASLAAGHPVEVEEEASLADSLGGGIGLDNQYTFFLARKFVDEVVLLPEAAIAHAMRHLYLAEGLVTEGAAAVGAAVILDGLAQRLGKHIAVVISGRNVDMDIFQRVVAGEVPY
jgi:threonine dehydratase